MSDEKISANELFGAAVAERRTGILEVRYGRSTYALVIGPTELHLMSWSGLPEPKITEILTYEGVAGEEDFLLAIQESKKKNRPIEQVLMEFGLLEEDLLPAIEERMIIELVYRLLESGEGVSFEDTEGDPPGDPELTIGLDAFLEFVAKVELDEDEFAKHATAEDIFALDGQLADVLKAHEVNGFSTTVGRLCDSKRSVETIAEDSKLPRHYVVRTLLGFLKVGAVKKLTFTDLAGRAADTEQQGKFDEAYELYAAAHRLRDSDIDVLEKLAKLAELVEDKPGIARYNNLLAEHAVSIRNEPLAVKHYERVAKVDVHHFESHDYLFKFAGRQQQTGEMIRLGRELIRIHSENRNLDEAMKVAERCLQAAPDDLKLLEGLAKTHVARAEKDEAVSTYERVLAIHDKRGDKQEAWNVLMTLRRIAPERQEFQRRINAVHSAERRRTMIKMGALAMVPVLIIGLAVYLYFQGLNLQYTTARDSLMHDIRSNARVEDVPTLQGVLRKIQEFQEDYPGDEEVEAAAVDINKRIVQIEEQARRAQERAAREAEGLLEKATEARIGPPPDLERAKELLTEAERVAPGAERELLERISSGLRDVAEEIRRRDLRQIRNLGEDFDQAFEENDLVRCRERLVELEVFVDQYEEARDSWRERSANLKTGQRAILESRMREANELFIAGNLAGARKIYEEVVRVADDRDRRLVEDANDRLERIAEQTNTFLELKYQADSALEEGDWEFAIGLMRRLYTDYRSSLEPEDVRLPSELAGLPGTGVDIVTLELETGEVLEDVELPWVKILPVGEKLAVRVSKPGYTTATYTLHATFDREDYSEYVNLLREPTWTYELDGSMAQQPLIEGELVLLASAKSALHAVRLASGEAVWESPYALGGITGFVAQPQVAGDVVVISTTTRKVVGVDLASGAERWSLPVPNKLSGGVAVSADGRTAFVGTENGSILAIDAGAGRVVREGSLGSAITSEILLAGGRLYVGTRDDRLHAVDASSLSSSWHVETGGDVQARPALAGDLIVFGARDSRVVAVTGQGEVDWRTRVGGPVTGELAVQGDLVFAATAGGEGAVVALSLSSGEIVARSEPTAPIPGGVAASASRVFFGAENSRIYAQAVVDGEFVQQWNKRVAGNVSTAPLYTGGRLLVGTSENEVFCFLEE